MNLIERVFDSPLMTPIVSRQATQGALRCLNKNGEVGLCLPQLPRRGAKSFHGLIALLRTPAVNVSWPMAMFAEIDCFVIKTSVFSLIQLQNTIVVEGMLGNNNLSSLFSILDFGDVTSWVVHTSPHHPKASLHLLLPSTDPETHYGVQVYSRSLDSTRSTLSSVGF